MQMAKAKTLIINTQSKMTAKSCCQDLTSSCLSMTWLIARSSRTRLYCFYRGLERVGKVLAHSQPALVRTFKSRRIWRSSKAFEKFTSETLAFAV